MTISNWSYLLLKRVKQHTFKLYAQLQLKEYKYFFEFSINKTRIILKFDKKKKKNMLITNEHQLINSY